MPIRVVQSAVEDRILRVQALRLVLLVGLLRRLLRRGLLLDRLLGRGLLGGLLGGLLLCGRHEYSARA